MAKVRLLKAYEGHEPGEVIEVSSTLASDLVLRLIGRIDNSRGATTVATPQRTDVLEMLTQLEVRLADEPCAGDSAHRVGKVAVTLLKWSGLLPADANDEEIVVCTKALFDTLAEGAENWQRVADQIGDAADHELGKELVDGTKRIVSSEEYEDLLQRAAELSAIEAAQANLVTDAQEQATQSEVPAEAERGKPRKNGKAASELEG